MRSELDEALELYEDMTGKTVDIYTHWTSMNHVNHRRILMYYRRFLDHGMTFYDEIGNRKFLKRHKWIK
jgi:hypothetical protein